MADPKLAQSRTFDISDVLSVTTGRLVSTRHIEGVYDILNYMTGDNLFTHALPRAVRACAPVLLEQHPQLRDIEYDHVDTHTWRDWLQEQRERFGDSLEVAPLARWQSKDPFTEAAEFLSAAPDHAPTEEQ